MLIQARQRRQTHTILIKERQGTLAVKHHTTTFGLRVPTSTGAAGGSWSVSHSYTVHGHGHPPSAAAAGMMSLARGMGRDIGERVIDW